MLDHAGVEVEAKGEHLVHKCTRTHEKTMHSFVVIVAERLRRLTRNQLGSARAGSSPADDVLPRLLLLPMTSRARHFALAECAEDVCLGEGFTRSSERKGKERKRPAAGADSKRGAFGSRSR